ncbi:MAG: VWA domain-containing protein [Rhodobacteraceae bacterium]|nr:VWA domain-containing protein [Paracoccaceae bacterium]MCP5341793.1 VWA domain-containing protein [Paracoccaceae bacterium]
MITFLWPLAFLALPAPILVRYFQKPLPQSANGALRVPFFAALQSHGTTGGRRPLWGWLRLAAASAIWLLLVSALARPVMVGPEVPLPAEGRDIMMAIDLSGSMGREDFALNGQASTRLGVVKQTANDFIERRKGDRIGLVLFSDRAYLQAPLTFDRDVVRQLLDQAQVGLTGTETAIGDAIAIAVKRLKDRPANERVLVLLTDGASNAGVMTPLAAADLARKLGVKIYTIGVGADRMVVNSGFGQQVVNPSQDLDEATLTEIAARTGGLYFRATNLAGLADIYREIDKLEPIADDPLYLHPSIALYYWPLGAALVLIGLLALGYAPRTLPVRRRTDEVTP